MWPTRPRAGSGSFLAASFADVLAVHGFATADELHPMVQGWQGLLDLARPALVVCDHSPTLCLAALGFVAEHTERLRGKNPESTHAVRRTAIGQLSTGEDGTDSERLCRQRWPEHNCRLGDTKGRRLR